MRNKLFAIVSVLVLLSMVLSACGGAATAPTQAPAPTTAPAEPPAASSSVQALMGSGPSGTQCRRSH